MSSAGVAVLAKRGRFLVAEPAFERGRNITLDGRGAKGANLGDLVLLGLGKRGARVVRRIGRPDNARDVVEALMLDRGLRRTFPRAVEAEAADCAASPPWEGPRRDLTDLPTFTIDPATAKDFDDAVSARREGDRVRVWIHIADVSAYVRPGSLTEPRDLPPRHQRLRPGRGRTDAPRSLVERRLLAAPGHRPQRGYGRGRDGRRRARVDRVLPLGHP